MNTHRYIARIILQAETGLFVGSGQSSLNTDALVQKDHHGLPMIQGTSLTGVLKHSLANDIDKDKLDDLLGFQNGKEGKGSLLKISSAYLMIDQTQIAEGLTPPPADVLSKYTSLPKRQHVRINHKGVNETGGLFDNEVVYAGSRFIFEIELTGNEDDKTVWNKILQAFQSPMYRIGQGTRNGFGKLKVVALKSETFDLINGGLSNYLNHDPSLNTDFVNYQRDAISYQTTPKGFNKYELKLTPDNFFIFGEGLGDLEVDNKPKTEKKVVYSTKGITLEPYTLLPASSIKGALSHRTAFHYNKTTRNFADDKTAEELKAPNVAVQALFGIKGGEADAHRGYVVFEDYFIEKVNNNKIFNHVAIDRFTGGAMEGALFSEKVSQKTDNETINICIILETTNLEDTAIVPSFEEALTDICKGLLPLGGMTTKGHGFFNGELFKDDVQIYPLQQAN